MRVFHADAVAAVDVILEPFKVGEGRVIAGARDFEEGPAGPDGLGRQSTRRTQSGIRSSRGESFVEIMPTQISFLLFIPHCGGDFSQIDLLSEG
jgi:hypothetical protein